MGKHDTTLGLERKDASGAENKSLAALTAELKALFDTKHDKVKEIADEALAEAKKGNKLAESLTAKADEALSGMNEVKTSLDALEQKLAKGGGDRQEEVKTIGQAFVESQEFKDRVGRDGLGRGEKVRVEHKATMTTSTAAAAGSLGAAINQTRLPGVIDIPRRPLTIRSLLAQGNMTGQVIEYVRKHSNVRNAAMVAEGAAKPQSDFRLELVTTQARVIAHTFKVSRQAMSDVDGLRSMIDLEGVYGLDLAEEAQLLSGDGTGQNLLGLIPQATPYAAPHAVAALQQVDIVRLAVLQASLALLPASGIVINPIDWSVIETLKDTQNRYLWGNPQGTLSPTLWGLPVVATMAMTEDKFLVGAFNSAAQIFDRWDTIIEMGYENDDFTRNLSTILYEKRLALAVYRPGALIYGDFGRVV